MSELFRCNIITSAHFLSPSQGESPLGIAALKSQLLQKCTIIIQKKKKNCLGHNARILKKNSIYFCAGS